MTRRSSSTSAPGSTLSVCSLSSLVSRIDAALEADSAELASAPSPGESSSDNAEVGFDFGPGLDPSCLVVYAPHRWTLMLVDAPRWTRATR